VNASSLRKMRFKGLSNIWNSHAPLPGSSCALRVCIAFLGAGLRLNREAMSYPFLSVL
jgi:hypothetical protein